MLLSINQVADELALSRESVRKLIIAGELRAHRFGNVYRVHEVDLLTYMTVSIVRDLEAAAGDKSLTDEVRKQAAGLLSRAEGLAEGLRS